MQWFWGQQAYANEQSYTGSSGWWGQGTDAWSEYAHRPWQRGQTRAEEWATSAERQRLYGDYHQTHDRVREPPHWRPAWPWREPQALIPHRNRDRTGSDHGGRNGDTTPETAFSFTSPEARPTTPHEDGGSRDEDLSGAGDTTTSVERYREVMRAAVDEFIGDSTEEKVYVLTIKGNYRHKLLKLGIEKAHEKCTEKQKKLATILKESGLLQRWPPTWQGGRPPWAGGACLYLTPAAVKSFAWGDDALRKKVLGVRLQSKHIVCSCLFLKIVEEALHDAAESRNSTFDGREAFLIRRAGTISEKLLITLPLPNAATD